MYLIIGGDGKEYGPVPASQVRAWVRAGRANDQTRVKAAGSDTWTSIADVPELSGDPMAAPPVGGFPGVSPAPGPLSAVRCYERSFHLVKTGLPATLGVGFVTVCFLGSAMLLEYAGLYYVTPLLAGPIVGGIYYFILQRMRGLPAGPGTLLSGFSRAFVPLALLGILDSVIGALITYFPMVAPVWASLIVVPLGVYLGVCFSFSQMVAVDRQVSAGEAVMASWRMAGSQWWRVFGLLLLGIPFVLLGIAALGVGLLVAFPLIYTANLYAYEDLSGRPS
jgi:uncharacterized membrane protein